MTWESTRGLPPDWEPRRERVLERDDHACTWIMPNGARCGRYANQVDHIGDRHDHSEENLRSLCDWHHKKRTSAQGNAARTRVTEKRAPEKHPGLL